MRLEYVKSFIGVVNYKSFSRAAKYLYLSQPTISTHIRQLEDELGVQLLVRSTKDVLPSEEGKIFYPYALQLVETENQALEHLKKGRSETGKVVSMAVSSALGNTVLPAALTAMRADRRDIALKVIEGSDEFVLQKVADREVEIGISALTGDGRIHADYLYTDRIILVTPNNENYSNYKGLFPVRQLEKENFVMLSDTAARYDMTFLEKEFGLDMSAAKVAAMFESSGMALRAVEEGGGVAFINRSQAREMIRQNRIRGYSFNNPAFKKDVWLLTRDDRELDEAALAVREAFLQAAGKQGEEKA